MKKSHSFARTMALLAYVSVMILGLSSCKGHNDDLSANSGKLCLSLSADTTSLKKGIDSNFTKAVSDEFEKFLDVDDYMIRIVQGDKTIQTYDRFKEMPSEVELPEGTYSLIASKGDDLPAQFENPYFEGSADFTVKAEMTSPIEVVCTLGNARVTVDYTEEFKKVYDEYATLLKTSFIDNALEIAKEEQRPAYLQVDKDGTELNVSIRLKKIGGKESKVYPVPTTIPLDKRQNVRLIFKTDGASNGIGLDVVLDDKLGEQTFWPEIPDFMLPDKK